MYAIAFEGFFYNNKKEPLQCAIRICFLNHFQIYNLIKMSNIKSDGDIVLMFNVGTADEFGLVADKEVKKNVQTFFLDLRKHILSDDVFFPKVEQHLNRNRGFARYSRDENGMNVLHIVCNTPCQLDRMSEKKQCILYIMSELRSSFLYNSTDDHGKVPCHYLLSHNPSFDMVEPLIQRCHNHVAYFSGGKSGSTLLTEAVL